MAETVCEAHPDRACENPENCTGPLSAPAGHRSCSRSSHYQLKHNTVCSWDPLKKGRKRLSKAGSKIKLWLELATSCFTLLGLLLNFHEATWALLGLVYVWTWVCSTEIQLYLGRGSFSQKIQKICGMGTRATVHARATPICTAWANLQGQLPSCTSHLIWQLGIYREK